MANDRVSALLDYATTEGRVCPLPNALVKLREMLGPDSPQISILAGWWLVPPGFKSLILDAQIRYAAEHGLVMQVDQFLRGLPDREWLHDSFRRLERPQPTEQLTFDL